LAVRYARTTRVPDRTSAPWLPGARGACAAQEPTAGRSGPPHLPAMTRTSSIGTVDLRRGRRPAVGGPDPPVLRAPVRSALQPAGSATGQLCDRPALRPACSENRSFFAAGPSSQLVLLRNRCCSATAQRLRRAVTVR